MKGTEQHCGGPECHNINGDLTTTQCGPHCVTPVTLTRRTPSGECRWIAGKLRKHPELAAMIAFALEFLADDLEQFEWPESEGGTKRDGGEPG